MIGSAIRSRVGFCIFLVYLLNSFHSSCIERSVIVFFCLGVAAGERETRVSGTVYGPAGSNLLCFDRQE
jgi:hypothetical protein